MTPIELRHLALPRYGTDWQSPLARAVVVAPRTIRRLAAGDRPITPAMEARIRTALGNTAGAPTRVEWIQGRWLKLNFMIHAMPPRFIARIIAAKDPAAPTPYPTRDGRFLCEFQWIDAPPAAAAMAALMAAAGAAVKRRQA